MEMPLGFSIYPEHQLLFIRGKGVITQPERIAAMLAWLRDPGYAACEHALFDISNAESIPKVADLRQLIAILRAEAPPNGPRRLAVVTSKPIAFAVLQVFGRILQLNGILLEVKAFRGREHAWEWLRPGVRPVMQE